MKNERSSLHESLVGSAVRQRTGSTSQRSCSTVRPGQFIHTMRAASLFGRKMLNRTIATLSDCNNSVAGDEDDLELASNLSSFGSRERSTDDE